LQRFKDIQIPQLRSFCLAALQGNFTAAAKSQGLSITTVWQHVRTLEQKLGGTLLRVEGRSLRLTPEGKLLLDLVHPHLVGLESLQRLFETHRQELPRHLTVAATHYLFCYHLARPLEEYTRKHPSVSLNLRGGIWPDVIRFLEQGAADLGVVSYGPDGPRSQHLEYEHLFDLQFSLLASKRHPLAHKKNLKPSDLVDQPLILSAKETYGYKTLERLLAKHELLDRVHIVMETPNTDIMRRYASLGLGIALAYTAPDRDPPMPGLVQRVFDPTLEKLPVVLAIRKWAHLPDHVEEFRQTLRRHLGHRRTAGDHAPATQSGASQS
jgi:DNA-binding transcriptional LysR family regulator